MTTIPNDRRYTASHEWVQIDGNTATIGITEHAQEQLGDLVFVQLPDVGTSYGKGDELITLESVKAAADIFCPAAATVTATNASLDDDPEQINNHPYDSWLVQDRSN